MDKYNNYQESMCQAVRLLLRMLDAELFVIPASCNFFVNKIHSEINIIKFTTHTSVVY